MKKWILVHKNYFMLLHYYFAPILSIFLVRKFFFAVLRHFKKSDAYGFLFLGNGVLSTTDNPLWRAQRQHLVEAFLPEFAGIRVAAAGAEPPPNMACAWAAASSKTRTWKIMAVSALSSMSCASEVSPWQPE